MIQKGVQVCLRPTKLSLQHFNELLLYYRGKNARLNFFFYGGRIRHLQDEKQKKTTTTKATGSVLDGVQTP